MEHVGWGPAHSKMAQLVVKLCRSKQGFDLSPGKKSNSNSVDTGGGCCSRAVGTGMPQTTVGSRFWVRSPTGSSYDRLIIQKPSAVAGTVVGTARGLRT